jgi:hypothetical protein
MTALTTLAGVIAYLTGLPHGRAFATALAVIAAATIPVLVFA